VWQKLSDELKDQGFMVITVAMESRGNDAARGPIRRAKSTYVSLIDRDHLVAELYNMLNVPQAVWIDESGRIVRPAENAGAAITLNLSRVRAARRSYLDAIRDWVEKGEASQYVFTEQEAREHLSVFTEDIARAHANFHFGQHLWQRGDRKQAARFLERAIELSPDSWNFFRQTRNLEHLWGSAGPAFIRRVMQSRKQGKEYYPLPDLSGRGSPAGS
jgi:tetratricopeptide (TPR) repeat protein